MSSSLFNGACARLSRACVLGALALIALPSANAQIALADRPLLTPDVAGNLALALSVEWPTAVGVAHTGDYDPARVAGYLGYFDPNKCYSYQYYSTESATQLSHFYPDGVAAANHNCQSQTGRWSGNFLNWATLQTIDSLRWAMTGGKRRIDNDSGTTILEKARHTGQGGTGVYPNKELNTSSVVAGATPLPWSAFRMRIEGVSTGMRFTRLDSNGNEARSLYETSATTYDPANPPGTNSTRMFELQVRVRVCHAAAPGGVESNCRLYGSYYKPEGLIQQYSDRIRYSTFGYLNDSTNARGGGILRARQKFVAPVRPRPGLPGETNPNREWDASTGVMTVNPDPDDALAFGSAVLNSGVMNYLNKFGQANDYKGQDPVSELYYAALRYFKNQQNVPAWSNLNNGDATVYADGFPVITTWGDPIQYSCQSNFILGIGDVNTHADKNVPGASTGTTDEPTKPTEISNDTSVDAVIQTNAVSSMEGLGENVGTTYPFNGCCTNNSALMAGLAYDAHVRDIRPEVGMPGVQTIKTLWVDVLEARTYKRYNQYYLAAKYGGFRVPQNFNYAANAAAMRTQTLNALGDLTSWNRNGQTLSSGSALSSAINVSNPGNWDTAAGNPSGGNNRRPDTYFTAGDPQSMLDGLREAFSTISSDLTAASTSFSLASPQVNTANNSNISYSAQYNNADWTGRLSARYLNFSATGVPTPAATELWNTDATLATQFTGTNGNGWDSARYVVTTRTDTRVGTPFRAASLPTAQLNLLDTPFVAGNDSAAYLNYLRGSRTNEGTSVGNYRVRTRLLGDIAGSKVTAVGAPISRYSDAANPGYAAFVTAETSRQRMVYVGANDGMLHAFNGEASGGNEVFAYVPSALFNGPTSPAADGLVSRGNPLFEHKALVDATAEVFDIDFNRTAGATGTESAWRSVLIGGLGKGGRSYYAIDVTSPQTVAGETGWAGRVLWEFPSAANAAQMGFTYGKPLVTKTARYGWVVIFPSGYNSTGGGSYLFFVNPRTGALLQAVPVGNPAITTSAQASSGLAHVQAYRRDFADNTAESVYAADLQGNVWRVDVRSTVADYSATQLAQLSTPSTGNARQAVTTRLLVEIDPASGRRYVLVGTGRLLDTTDIASTAEETFYAIVDGTRALFDPSIAVVTRDDLVRNTAGAGGTLSSTAGVVATAERARGWFLDLGTGAGGVASRLVLDPVTNAGRVAFSTLVPSAGDPCVQGTSRTYSINFGTGRTALTNATDYIEGASPVIDIRYVCVGSQCKLLTGRQTSTNGGVAGNSVEGTPEEPLVAVPLRRLNWRELQIVQ